MKKVSTYFIVLLLLVLPLSLRAQATQTTSAAAQLTALLNNLKTFSANFQQVVYSNQGTVLQKSSGDMEMWLRAAFVGGAQFKMIPGVYGLYYHSPSGISTNPNSHVYTENKRIWTTLRDIPKNCFDHIELLV